MPRTPAFLSQAPASLTLEVPRVDVLADVLGVSLLRNALYKRIEARAPWGLRVQEKTRATFYLVARGSARLELEGAKAILLGPGDAVFMPHGTAHVLRDSPTTEPVEACGGSKRTPGMSRRIGGTGAPTSLVAGFFQREPGHTPPLLARMPNVVVLSGSDASADPWVAATIRLILAESETPGPASTLVMQRLADVLFVHALRSLTRARRAQCPKGLPALEDPAIHQALALMHADVTMPWTVASLAKRVGLSRSGFAARFTELVGQPPLQYLMRWRLSRAAELLRDTGDDITVVAARVGYESVPSFSRTFKRFQGASPAAFRKAQRNAT